MKPILFVLLALLLSGVASAQIVVKPALGFSVTDFSEDVNGSKAKYGTQVGASVAFYIGDNFYIEPGMFSTSKSTEFETSTNTPSIEAYVEGLRIPISVGCNILGDVGTFASLRGFVGPSGYFVTNVGTDVDGRNFKRINWGVYSGVSIDVWNLFTEVSYEWSLTNFQKDNSVVDLGKHRSFYVNFGYRLRF
jgi:hypothetical protein